MPKKLTTKQAQKAFLSMPAPSGSTGRKVAISHATPGSKADAPASASKRKATPKAASFTPTTTASDLRSKPSVASPKARPKMRARGKLAVAAVVGGTAAGAVSMMGLRKKTDAPGETKARAARLHQLHDTLYKKKK